MKNSKKREDEKDNKGREIGSGKRWDLANIRWKISSSHLETKLNSKLNPIAERHYTERITLAPTPTPLPLITQSLTDTHTQTKIIVGKKWNQFGFWVNSQSTIISTNHHYLPTSTPIALCSCSSYSSLIISGSKAPENQDRQYLHFRPFSCPIPNLLLATKQTHSHLIN